MAKQNTIRNSSSDTPSKKKSSRKKKSEKKPNETIAKIKTFFGDEKLHKSIGALLLLLGVYFAIAFISYLFTWKNDQAFVKDASFWSFVFSGEELPIKNWLGKLGAFTGHSFVYGWFGIASLLIPFNFILWGVRILFKASILPLRKTLAISAVTLVWVSITMGFFFKPPRDFMGGVFGFQTTEWIRSAVGGLGTMFFILATAFIGVVVLFNPRMPNLGKLFNKDDENQIIENNDVVSNNIIKEKEEIIEDEIAPVIDFNKKEDTPTETQENAEVTPPLNETEKPHVVEDLGTITGNSEKSALLDSLDEDFSIVVPENNEAALSEKEINEKVKEFGEYDPKLDLSQYQLPGIELLADHGGGAINVNKQELEDNKNKIVETLGHYSIKIAKIKATIGPSVTLYEIVPAAGVRISKIKNLEDDIALSLAALGIRIIAPMPGRGTIGIEVPNSDPEIVSMKALIASDKFQNSKMELPVALGKTISNETLVADLAKMPHLLMAGATGQGKSVGLNAILVSLLYKKHPSQIKFVLVDPKKVELTLYNKIERHFLAKLPDDSDAIITDTSKVVATLNSLCVEMDQRYELLKNAMVRNIKEYNVKFVARKLNPENGHRFLPYIVLVVDEFADLIMTAGKEVETPIARLAQLARAIGIHLIVATQRPSVNVITGIIKANFPARIAFRVTSKIDSRTILDAGGADQLIGRGDMLYSPGNEIIRLQCGFVDTPEVEEITDFIGSQRGYPEAFMLPEYVDESVSQAQDLDSSDRDTLFEEAAEVIVNSQQGSASMLQRKLKLGYNRAGRIVDQLEAAGIIGPHKGSKARDVLIPDIESLARFLEHERKDNEIN